MMTKGSDSRQLVSVLMPVYNADRYLGEAIESVLSQTYKSLEIIVVDDGSTDSSAKVVQGFGSSVIYYFQENAGIGPARNKAIELSRGSFLAFIDADDLWTNDKLTLQMEALEMRPDLDMVFGHAVQFFSPDSVTNLERKMKIIDAAIPCTLPSALLIKRASFFRVGLFATEWRVGEFVDWYLKAVELGLRSLVLPQILVKRRVHDDNIGIRERGARADYLRILKKSLDRRRKYEI